MFRNYLMTAWKVFLRRKMFTAINLLCIVLTLVVVAALLPIRDWKAALNRFAIQFEDRVPQT